MKETVKTLWIGYLLTHHLHIFFNFEGVKIENYFFFKGVLTP